MQDDRYSRQIRFQPIGAEGQEALRQSHAIFVGCGALGSIGAELLTRAGVGHLTLIDRDFVEFSNLQRQFLFDEADASNGVPKAIAAARRLAAINRSVNVHPVVDDLRPRRAAELLAGADLIVDATDNFEARYLINDFAVEQSIPWIYGAAVGSYGITMPVLPGDTPCFRCVYPDPPAGAQPTCETTGVLGTVTALIASLQATAALQILSRQRTAVRRKITFVDVWQGPLRELNQPERDPVCPCCGQRHFEWLWGEREAPVSLCGRNAVQIHAGRGAIDLTEMRSRLAPFGDVRANEFALRFLLNPYEMTVFPDGRAIVKGTTDIALARSFYAKWVGA